MNFDDNYPKRNHEGYPDPTVEKVVKTLETEQIRQAHLRYKRTMGIILNVIDLAGFEAISRIVLRDKNTGTDFSK